MLELHARLPEIAPATCPAVASCAAICCATDSAAGVRFWGTFPNFGGGGGGGLDDLTGWTFGGGGGGGLTDRTGAAPSAAGTMPALTWAKVIGNAPPKSIRGKALVSGGSPSPMAGGGEPNKFCPLAQNRKDPPGRGTTQNTLQLCLKILVLVADGRSRETWFYPSIVDVQVLWISRCFHY